MVGLSVLLGTPKAPSNPLCALLGPIAVMCEKCAELDKSIERLRRLVEQLSDPGTITSAKQMIEEMEVEKAALHHEQQR